jgi:NADH:ubiquinone oxidoreductase subunit K
VRFLASAPLVDFGALLRILVLALAVGAGVVSAFSIGLVGVSEYTTHRTETRGYAGIALAVVCFAICVAAVGLGLFVMLARKG